MLAVDEATFAQTSDEVMEGWSEGEQEVIKIAFKAAYQRAIDGLITTLQSESQKLKNAEDTWKLHDYLSSQRHAIEGRFNLRFQEVLFVFASFVKDGLLNLDELQGLAPEKIIKISVMSKF